mgnify:CR=1 FL=1
MNVYAWDLLRSMFPKSFRTVGNEVSHEFHVLADSGEDSIVFCPDSTYAANIEFAEALHSDKLREGAKNPIQKIATPNKKTCEEVAEFLKIPVKKIVKTLAVVVNDEMVLLLIMFYCEILRHKNTD